MNNINTAIDQVTQKIEELIVECKRIHKVEIKMPNIVFDIRENSNLLGQAFYRDPKDPTKSKLRFNIRNFNENPEIYIKEVVTHEFAHLVVCKLDRFAKTHGKIFASVVRSFGATFTGATFNFGKFAEGRSMPTNSTVSTTTASSKDLQHILELISALSENDQLAINKALVENIKMKRKIDGSSAAVQFAIGQIISYTSPKVGHMFLKIQKFSRDGSAITGIKMNKNNDGTFLEDHQRWKFPTVNAVAI